MARTHPGSRPNHTTRLDADRAPHWRDLAACNGHNPDLFHPGSGDPKAIREAKRICRGCLVQAACLAEALSYSEEADWGVRGALSRNERLAIRRTHRQQTRAAA